eukprot:scaffold69_cov248-Pinguiococcus_pyrenoidosus.AAC.26
MTEDAHTLAGVDACTWQAAAGETLPSLGYPMVQKANKDKTALETQVRLQERCVAHVTQPLLCRPACARPRRISLSLRRFCRFLACSTRG